MRILTYFRPAAEIPGAQIHHRGQLHSKANNQTDQAGLVGMAINRVQAPVAKTRKRRRRRKRIDLLSLRMHQLKKKRMGKRRGGKVKGNRVLVDH